MQQVGYNTGIYCRLSREDGNDESQSISSQKEVLTKYVEDQGWTITDIYIDDGYSGTDFDRPAFKRLINDIKVGRINLVVTKDLSRLGRNYIQTGYYTEEFFPDYDVRYIALNDGYDSIKDEGNEFIPFKNIINEWYAKDISKKIRFTLDSKAKSGEPKRTAFPVFGYMYNEANERVPDPELAPIVKFIFEEYLKTASSTKVTRILKEKKIKIPSYYNAIKYGYDKENVLAKTEEELITWHIAVVKAILHNNAYTGTYTTAKHKTKSFKNHKLIKNENCYIFENKYEAIIDKETFEAVQRLLSRSRGSCIPMEENKFKALVFCPDCGKPLRYERKDANNDKKRHYRYFCRNPKCEFTNNIQKKYLDAIVKDELLTLKEFILSHEEEFIQFVENYDSKPKVKVDDIKPELDKYIARNSEIDLYIQKLFESNARSLVPETTFNMMMSKYTKEKKNLENHIKELTILSTQKEDVSSVIVEAKNLVEMFKNIKDEDILDSKFLHLVIDKIKVKSTLKEGMKRKYNYDIYIRYVKLDAVLKEFIDYESSHIC